MTGWSGHALNEVQEGQESRRTTPGGLEAVAAAANLCSPFFLGTGPMSEDQLLARAIQPLQDRISSLEATVDSLNEKIAALEATASHLGENQEIQANLICHLKEAARKEPQPTQKDRAEILRALLVANGGKMLAKDARKKIHIKKNHFSELLRVCDFVETKPFHLDRRQTVIILKSELVPRD